MSIVSSIRTIFGRLQGSWIGKTGWAVFVPGLSGLKRGIDLIVFGKQSILPCANFYASGEKTAEQLGCE